MYNVFSSNEKQWKYLIKGNISQMEFEHIQKSLEELVLVSNEIDYWCLFSSNIQKLKQEFHHVNNDDDLMFIRLNGAFANCLNSYYLWKCYHNHDKTDYIEKIKKDFRSRYIECYLFSELRNALAHDGFIITQTSYDVLNEEMHIEIDPALILETNRKLNGKLRDYLEKLKEDDLKIQVIELIDKIEEIYEKAQKQLWEAQKKAVRENLNLIFAVIPSSLTDFYNTYIESDDGNIHYNIGQKLYHFIIRSNMYYPDFISP